MNEYVPGCDQYFEKKKKNTGYRDEGQLGYMTAILVGAQEGFSVS